MPDSWFRTTLYSIGDAVITTDASGRIREMNPPAEHLTGWAEAEARGRPIDEVFRIVNEMSREPVENPLRRVLAEGIVVGLANHTLLISRDGTERPIADSGAPIRSGGSIIGAVLVFRDQSDERRAVRALEESQARLVEAQRVGRLASWEIDFVSKAHYWSDEMFRLFEVERAAPRTSVWAFLEMVPSEERPEVEAAFRLATEQRLPYDMIHRIQTPAGKIKHVHSRGETHYDAGGRPLRTVGTLLDITSRWTTGDLLLRQAALVNSVSDAVIATDLEFRIEQWNKSAELLFGWPEKEVLGRVIRELLQTEYDNTTRDDAARQLYATGFWSGEVRIRCRDGSRKSILSSVSMIRDPRGRATGVVAVNRDITERKELQAALARARQMESVGRLAGGVAHDFNNALQIILTLAEMGLERLAPDAPARAELEGIEVAARRSANLARQLLAFARQQTAQPKVVDLNAVTAECLQILGRLIGDEIDILWKPGAELGPIRIDPAQVDQILANLAVNAREAITGPGVLEISTANVKLGEEYVRFHPDTEAGDYVVLAVRDTGAGMDQATRDRAFEPFFTTKALGKGTGLGLAVVYGIVKQYQGSIDVETAPGQGTTFRLYLPRWSGEVPAEPLRSAPRPVLAGTETIVIVEDEEQILRLAQRTLERSGYRVMAFADPVEAARLIGRWPEQIDLLITDVVMPNLTGRALAERLRATRPDLPCLFISGYPADVIADNGVVDEGIHFLQKPFTVRQLGEKVRELLDRRPPNEGDAPST